MKYLFKSTLALVLIVTSWNAFAHTDKCSSMHHLDQRIQQDPSLTERMQQLEVFTQDYISKQLDANKTGGPTIITIPTVVHVVYRNATENITDAQIQTQIDVLNADFRKMNSDLLPSGHPFASRVADVGVEFCLAKRDPQGNATNGITRTQTTVAFTGNGEEKSSATGGKDNWDPTKYMNLWVCNLDSSGGTLGYATFPSDLATNPSEDGVTIRYEAFGTTGTAGSGSFTVNNLGRTGTHEVGHWLNLFHVWGDNQPNCGDDMVADTEPSNGPNYGCPSFPFDPNNACGSGPNGQTYMNYMDYVDDSCMNMFTNGQASRMQAALNGPRSGLLTSMGCVPPSTGGCDVPGGLSASTTATSATLSWTAVAGATSYQLTGGVVGGAAVPPIAVNGTSFTANNLATGSCYYWQVRAVCGTTGMSAYSAADTFCLSCDVPQNPASTLGAPGSVTLSWDPVSGAVGYIIQGGPTSAPTAASITVIGQANTSYTVNNLAPGTYQWRVRAGCSVSPLVLSQFSGYDFFTMAGSQQKDGYADLSGQKQALDVSVYPNPARDNVTVQLANPVEEVQLRLVDLTGKTLVNKVYTNQQQVIQLNTSNLSSGIYQLMITDGKNVQTEKLVIGR